MLRSRKHWFAIKNSINGQLRVIVLFATGRKTKETHTLLRLVELYGCIIFASFLSLGKKFWQTATIVFSLTNFRSEEKDVFVLPEESEIQNKQFLLEKTTLRSNHGC